MGNKVFALTLANAIGTNSSIRITNQRDVVTQRPSFSFGFHHLPREYWYRSATTYNTCNTSGEDRTCSMRDYATNVLDHLRYLGLNMADECRDSQPTVSDGRTQSEV